MSIYICIVYVPSIDSNIHKTNDINVFECIESGIEKYKEQRTWTAFCLLLQNHRPIYRKWSLRRRWILI